MGLFGFFSRKKKMTLADANAENESFFAENPDAKGIEDAKMRKASSLLTSGQFSAAAAAYSQMAEEYPAQKGLYLGQVGAAKFFMGEYGSAIDHYKSALEAGAHEGMMDDNIWEACEEIYKQSQDPAAAQKYLDIFPNGSNAKKASKLLAK